jgi:UBX domain-containing protein 1
MGRHTAGGSARPAPTAEDEDDDEEEEVQTRQLVFWRNGFSIEDGPLMEYDAPGNPELLRAIQSGRAPPSLFGVRYNQPLQVEVQQRTSEEYVKQEKKKPVGGFGGEGNRLGSVAPEVGGAGAVGSGSGGAAPAASVPVSQGGSTGNAPKFQVDETKPTTRLQLRLADGSK